MQNLIQGFDYTQHLVLKNLTKLNLNLKRLSIKSLLKGLVFRSVLPEAESFCVIQNLNN